MAAVPTKQMLEKILTSKGVSDRDREVFERMWDDVHRYGRLSKKQTSWIEDVYYKLQAPTKGPGVAFINVEGLTRIIKAHNLKEFKELYPEANATLRGKVRSFFTGGGHTLELRPKK